MQTRTLLLAALVAAASSPLGAQATTTAGSGAARTASSPQQVVDRAAKAWAKVTTLRAGFEQTVSNPLTGTTANAKGDLLMRRPGRFSVSFTDPAGDRVVGDGTHTWVYLPSTNPGQVIKLRSKNAPAGPGIVDELLTGSRDRFTAADAGTATIGGRATRAVTMTPATPVQFTKATIWVDDADGTVRQFELVEASGLVRRVRLTNVRLNASVPASSFTFTPPKNARVVDERMLGGT